MWGLRGSFAHCCCGVQGFCRLQCVGVSDRVGALRSVGSGLGFGVSNLGRGLLSRVLARGPLGSGFRIQEVGIRIWDARFRIQGFGSCGPSTLNT